MGTSCFPLILQSGPGVHQAFSSVNIGTLSEGVKQIGLDTAQQPLCSAEFDESIELYLYKEAKNCSD
jgi:hypothetical protein